MDCERRIFSLNSSKDGHKIEALLTLPKEEPKGVVQLVHGMAEHKLRYLELMEALSRAGYVCVMHDHRGHGSDIAAGHTEGDFTEEELLSDIGQVDVHMRRSFSGLPCFLFGHSMGALAARAYLRNGAPHLNGLILSGLPWKGASLALAPALVWILSIGLLPPGMGPRVMDRSISGRYTRRFKKENQPGAWLCGDAEEVRKYQEDAQCGFLFTMRGYRALIQLTRHAYEAKKWAVDNPNLPVLLLSGAADPCLSREGNLEKAAAFFRRLGYVNVRAKTYPGMRHEIMREKGKEEVWRDILSFLMQHR